MPSRTEIWKMRKVVHEQQGEKTAMEPQELETMQINMMKRKNGMLLDVFRARVRLR